MTFSKANPPGWTDPPVNSDLTATQLNKIDVNISRAIDGKNGGTYTPLSSLEFNGQGVSIGADAITGLGYCRRTGSMQFVGTSARTVWRTHVLPDADSSITFQYDVYKCTVSNASRIHSVLATNCDEGMKIRVYKQAAGTVATTVEIKRSGSLGSIVNFLAQQHACAELVFTGGVWRLLSYSPNCVPGADA